MTESKTEYRVRTNAERMRDFRAREKARGRHRITVSITPEAAETLTVLRAVYPDLNAGEIVSRALIRLALDKVARSAEC